MEFIYKAKHFLLKIIKNPATRLWISISFGVLLNFVYLAGNMLSTILYKSLWSATVTIYHLLFMTTRMYILYMAKDGSKNNSSVCLRVGLFLFVLDLPAAFMMIYSVRNGADVHYSGLLLLFFLLYTVYSVTNSIKGMIKWKNDNKPLHYAAKNITFASSLMSLFNLQFSLLSTIGLNSDASEKVTVIAGFSVFFIMILLSFRLIKRGISDSLR